MLCKWVGPVALMALSAGTLRADWKIVTIKRFNGGRSVITEYYKGGLHRIDLTADFHGHRNEWTTVRDTEHGRVIAWNPERREYSVTGHPPGTTAQVAATGPEIVIERSTVDTGERRTSFGRQAKHLITTETRTDSRLRGPVTTKTEIDGWYIEDGGLPRSRATYLAVFTAGRGGAPRIRVSQTGPAPGFAVQETRVSQQSGAQRDVESTAEVTELVERPLPEGLFAPPPGFNLVTRVSYRYAAQLSWFDRLSLGWQSFADWIATAFQ